MSYTSIQELLASLKLDLKQPLEKVSAGQGCRGVQHVPAWRPRGGCDQAEHVTAQPPPR